MKKDIKEIRDIYGNISGLKVRICDYDHVVTAERKFSDDYLTIGRFHKTACKLIPNDEIGRFNQAEILLLEESNYCDFVEFVDDIAYFEREGLSLYVERGRPYLKYYFFYETKLVREGQVIDRYSKNDNLALHMLANWAIMCNEMWYK